VLPKDRSINTANWDGYRGYWNIKDNRLCLDHIEIERYDKDKKRSHVENIPAADIRKVFGKYYQQKEIVATWFTADIRAAKGNIILHFSSNLTRDLTHRMSKRSHTGTEAVPYWDSRAKTHTSVIS
ncbi:MAG: hypothetical protein K6E52_08310, partial [Bacteroidaceae bacterium]|nr:hypothetical protein [Bacteroidaceae bacterium]